MTIYKPNSDSRSWAEITREYKRSIDVADRYSLPGPLGGVVRRLVRGIVRLNPKKARQIVRFGEPPNGRADMYVPQTLGSKGPRILLCNPLLQGGGAPKLIVEMAEILIELGYDPLLIAESDGPVRSQCERSGIPLIIHPPRPVPGHSAMLHFGEFADLIIANTVVAWRMVEEFSDRKPTIWYSHEISILENIRKATPAIDRVIPKATRMWAGSALAAAALRKIRNDVEVVPYGFEPINEAGVAPGSRHRIKLSLFATIEHRKGQDLAVDAVSLLSPDEQSSFDLHIRGRVLQSEFNARLEERAEAMPSVVIGGEMDEAEYRRALAHSDAILLTSRDDTLPLVSLDALSAGRVLMCTPTVGTADYITNGVNGFVSEATDAASIAAMLSRAFARRNEWSRIGEAGRALFDENFSRFRFAEKLQQTIDALLPAHVRPTK